jgi:NAD(P)-dependent dehydrogenase (short-subunit alcohol dehydrogenase family)
MSEPAAGAPRREARATASVVLVSGANSGIGRLCALAFARAGHPVAAGSRSAGRAAELARAAAAESLPLHVVRLDVTDPASVTRAVAETAELLGPVDVLVNNAGVMIAGPVECASEDSVRQVFETNVLGPLRLVQAVLPSMSERRRGSIVLVGSLLGRVPAPGASIYAASKQAAAALHDALSFEVEAFGIRVTTLDIGPYRTGIRPQATADNAADNAAAAAYAPVLDGLRARQARRLAESDDPAEVADAVLDAALRGSPLLHVAVGRHAREHLDGDDLADRFLGGLRRELFGNERDNDLARG